MESKADGLTRLETVRSSILLTNLINDKFAQRFLSADRDGLQSDTFEERLQLLPRGLFMNIGRVSLLCVIRPRLDQREGYPVYLKGRGHIVRIEEGLDKRTKWIKEYIVDADTHTIRRNEYLSAFNDIDGQKLAADAGYYPATDCYIDSEEAKALTSWVDKAMLVKPSIVAAEPQAR